MSNENKTIHDFELKLICDFFSNMERQGPGSPDVTLKALSFIDNLTENPLSPTSAVELEDRQWYWPDTFPGRSPDLTFSRLY